MSFGFSNFFNNYIPTSTPPPSYDVGRTAFIRVQGSGSNQSIAFTGAPPVNGTWIVFISTSGSSSGDGVPSGGSAWTAYASDNAPASRVYYKKCGASEPSSYTVAYSGSGKGDAIDVIMVEITLANSTNPTDSASYSQAAHGNTLTTTNQPVTSSNATSIAVVAATLTANIDPGANNVTLPPSGYTMQKYYPIDLANGINAVALATKTNVGTGTISPGSFTDQGSGTATLMFLTTTILFGP